MGRDEEVPEHFGMLHGDNLTPHRAIWTLATISAVLGAFAALFFFCGPAAPDDKTIATLPHTIWYALGHRLECDAWPRCRTGFRW